MIFTALGSMRAVASFAYRETVRGNRNLWKRPCWNAVSTAVYHRNEIASVHSGRIKAGDS